MGYAEIISRMLSSRYGCLASTAMRGLDVQEIVEQLLVHPKTTPNIPLPLNIINRDRAERQYI
jgi:hypothetical protein